MSVATEPSPGFTAINGRSPPSWSAERPRPLSNPTDAMENNLFSNPKPDQPHHFPEDDDASRKRKRPEADDGSPSSSSSQRRRLSPQLQSQSEILPPITNGQVNGVPFTTQEPHVQASKPAYMSPNDGQWQPQRSSVDENSTESRLMEVLGPRDASAQPQPNGTHGMPPINGHPPPNYPPPPPPPPSGEHQQPMPQPPPNGPLPTLQGMTAPGMQKQRKRNFANRTKTGCLTCRERKKKCDEGKPECNNCKRGGFECKGYSQSNPLRPGGSLHQNLKPSGFDTTSTQAYTTAPFISGPAFYHPDSQTVDHTRAPTFARDDPLRPLHDPSMAPNYSRPFPDPHMSPFMSAESIRSDYSHPPPIPDYTRDPKVKLPPPGSMGPPPGPPPRSSPFSNPQSVAQLALSQPNGHFSHLSPKNERDRMVNHHPFDPRDQALKEDRLQCNKRLAAFNKACEDPAVENAPSEYALRQLFKKIIDGDEKNREFRSGFVGENVDVQAPFKCDYGYNIKILDNVDIGRNCTICDACTVKIGKNCIIGPNVTIMAQDGHHHPDPPLRPGQKRLAIGKPVVIEDDVFIGANCVISFGITIGPGATIPAGTIVDQNIKAGTMVQRVEPGMRFAYGGWGPPQPR